MAKVKARATRTKAKKKHWLKIYSSKPFNEQVIGETLVGDSNIAIGKPVIVNLMTLTGDIKKQNTNIKFQVENVTDNRANTRVIGYEMVTAALKRLVRRRSSKIDMSFEATTADGVKIRLKPFILTRGKVAKSVLTSIRKAVKESIEQTISNTGFQNLVQDIVNHKIQAIMRKQLAKVHPIKTFEIKFLKIKKGSKLEKPVVEKVKPAEEKTKAEEKKETVKEEKPKKETKPEETKEPVKEEQEKQPKETKKEEPTKEPTETKVEQPDKEPTETKVEE